MREAAKDYIINTVFRTNILPVISECNTSCVFCSHRQNPDNVEVFRLPKLKLEDFRELLTFISPNKKIIIGESATRIIEGEPLLHKDFCEILELVRQKYKYTPIQVTTNGILLNEKIVSKLEELGNIELNISVNCIDTAKRKQILGNKRDEDIRDRLKLICGRLKFSGSCVWVPDIMNFNDVEDIIRGLDNYGADTVRVFLPGYTRLAGHKAELDELFKSLNSFIYEIRHKYSIPVIVEPSFLTDLNCRLEGIIKSTPSWKAGLETGDIILQINGKEVETRVAAFNSIFRTVNPLLKVKRGEKIFEVRLEKKRNTAPGFVVLYDADPEIVTAANETARRHNANKILFITSELAYAVLVKLFEISTLDFEYEIIPARNELFGGTIKCAGLLTVQDIIETIENYLESSAKPDLIMLPPIMFDQRKRDLTGRTIKEIEELFGIPADTI